MKIGKYELNKIYNEDCYEAIKNLPDKSVDLVVMDPPYEIETHGGGHSPLAKQIQKQHQELYENNLHIGVNNELLELLCQKMKKINICIFCNKKQIYQYLKFFEDKNCLFDLISWHKTNAIPNYSFKYMTDTEYCLVFRKGKEMNRESENYEARKTWYMEPINVSDKLLYKHPTIKPLELVKKMIINHSVEGEVVLDPFMGSGTTAVAAKELGRNFIGFEISKDFYNIACDRVNGITADGQTSIFTDFESL